MVANRTALVAFWLSSLPVFGQLMLFVGPDLSFHVTVGDSVSTLALHVQAMAISAGSPTGGQQSVGFQYTGIS